MPYRCNCPCAEMHCADPGSLPVASEEEQVLMVAEIGLVAAALGGAPGADQADAIATAIRLLPGMGQLTESQINAIMAQAGVRTQHGRRWLCEATNGIRSPALRRLAFRMASMFSAWHGDLGERQQEYLSAIAAAFNFSEGEAAKLFSQATGWNLQPA